MLRIALKLMVKQTIKIPKKSEYVKFKNLERKVLSKFMIYKDSEF